MISIRSRYFYTWMTDMRAKTIDTTVYYDGSCPLCAAEIQHYRNLDQHHKLDFVDVSDPDIQLPESLTRQQAMARFHVKSAGGQLMSGARAFAAVWSVLPKWRWAARVAHMPGVIQFLEVAYSVSLLVRPGIARVVGWFRSTKLRNSSPKQ